MIKVALFGRAGYGKSSIANMLIKGDIKSPFKVSDSARGETLNISSGISDSERYQVFDMVGVGEPSSHADTSHQKTVEEIRDYFSKCDERLNYIFYVHKKSRVSEEDIKMFKLFKDIFGWAERNFIIIITHCKPRWIENNENLEIIKRDFGNYPIIPVDFPSTDDDDDEDTARGNRNKREQSLQRLEAKLSELNYKGIRLEVLSSSQKTEKRVSEIVSIVPAVGSVYQLIAGSVYYKLGKPKQAKERLIDGTIGIALDVMGVGVAGASKSVSAAIIKNTIERTSYKVYTKITGS